MFSQYTFDFDEGLETINDALKDAGLHLLSDIGGGTGQPFFKYVISVTEARPKTVSFIVRFPKNPKVSAMIDGDDVEVELRFQRDGSMYHGGIVKVLVRGVLWEGEIFADAKEQRIWSVTWKLG